MCSISANLQVVASVSASDRWTWDSTTVSAVMFAVPYTPSSAAVFISASFLANVLLGPVTLVPTSCNSCRSWCWNNLLKSSCWTEVAWWISHSNHSFALSRSASDHLVATMLGFVPAHQKLPSYCCGNHFSALHLNLHCSTDCINLSCS